MPCKNTAIVHCLNIIWKFTFWSIFFFPPGTLYAPVSLPFNNGEKKNRNNDGFCNFRFCLHSNHHFVIFQSMIKFETQISVAHGLLFFSPYSQCADFEFYSIFFTTWKYNTRYIFTDIVKTRRHHNNNSIRIRYIISYRFTDNFLYLNFFGGITIHTTSKWKFFFISYSFYSIRVIRPLIFGIRVSSHIVTSSPTLRALVSPLP